MKINKFLPQSTLVLSLLSTSLIAHAAEEHNHQHAGDIQPWKSGTTILTNGNLFEADFGDLPGGLFNTDDPGIDSDEAEGPLTAGNWLRFQPVGGLKFWSGYAWIQNVPNGERIEIMDAVETVISYTPSGVNNTLGVIGEVAANGDVHEHLDFTIKDASNQEGGTDGAYYFGLTLSETEANSDTPIASSAPIGIVFIRGLPEPHEPVIEAAADINEDSAFNAANNILNLNDVQIGTLHYQVQLEFTDNHFVLKDYQTLPAQLLQQPAVYGGAHLTIPRVKAGGKYYEAELHNSGDFKFELETILEIPTL